MQCFIFVVYLKSYYFKFIFSTITTTTKKQIAIQIGSRDEINMDIFRLIMSQFNSIGVHLNEDRKSGYAIFSNDMDAAIAIRTINNRQIANTIFTARILDINDLFTMSNNIISSAVASNTTQPLINTIGVDTNKSPAPVVSSSSTNPRASAERTSTTGNTSKSPSGISISSGGSSECMPTNATTTRSSFTPSEASSSPRSGSGYDDEDDEDDVDVDDDEESGSEYESDNVIVGGKSSVKASSSSSNMISAQAQQHLQQLLAAHSQTTSICQQPVALGLSLAIAASSSSSTSSNNSQSIQKQVSPVESKTKTNGAGSRRKVHRIISSPAQSLVDSSLPSGPIASPASFSIKVNTQKNDQDQADGGLDNDVRANKRAFNERPMTRYHKKFRNQF